MKNLITLLLFAFPLLGITQADCDKIIVTDISIDPEKPGDAQISIYNGNEFLNNTWIERVIDENGDLVAGFGQFFHFYGQGESQYSTYPLQTDLDAIPSDLKATVYFKFRELLQNPSRWIDRSCDIPFPNTKVDSLKNRLKIYPNPTAGEFYVLFDNPTRETYTIEIYDLQGKRVMNNPILGRNGLIGSKGFVVQRKLPAGIYSVHLKRGCQLILHEKLVVQ